MKTFAGIAMGFALMPATMGLIGVFAWISIRFDLSKTDASIGAALGIARLVIGTLIVLKHLH